MRKKKDNLEPWLDYFRMLRVYEREGFLNVLPEKHEAYITRAALCTLACCDPEETLRLAKGVRRTLAGIRAYAGWMSRDGGDYLRYGFALHVVHEEAPHDPLCTVFSSRRRAWWKLWRMADRVEVIGYSEKP